jgi:hypothetical protein
MTPDALAAGPARSAFWRPGPLARYRWAVASRTLAAVFGGYVLSAAFAGALSLALPLAGVPRAEAVLWATLLAFLVHATAALWAFGCASAWRAWAGIGGPTVLCALAVWLLPRLPVGGAA